MAPLAPNSKVDDSFMPKSLRHPFVFHFIVASVVAGYTTVALIVNWEAALPVAVVEFLLVIYCLARNLIPQGRTDSVRCMGKVAAVLAIPSALRRCTLVMSSAVFILLHAIAIAVLMDKSVESFVSLFGLTLIIFLCWLASTNRKGIRWWPVMSGFTLQFWIAVIVLRTSGGQDVLDWLSCQVNALMANAHAGASFVFEIKGLSSPESEQLLGECPCKRMGEVGRPLLTWSRGARWVVAIEPLT